MSGGQRPAGLDGAARPALAHSNAPPLRPVLPYYSKHPSPAAPGKKKEEVGPTGLGGAGRPKIWPKNFEIFL